MDPDLSLVIGLVIGVFAIVGVVSALSDRRTPRVGAFALIVAGGFVLYAMTSKPGGYRFDQIPDAIFRVIAQVIA